MMIGKYEPKLYLYRRFLCGESELNFGSRSINIDSYTNQSKIILFRINFKRHNSSMSFKNEMEKMSRALEKGMIFIRKINFQLFPNIWQNQRGIISFFCIAQKLAKSVHDDRAAAMFSVYKTRAEGYSRVLRYGNPPLCSNLLLDLENKREIIEKNIEKLEKVIQRGNLK